MIFETEKQFEKALVGNLEKFGWNDNGGVLEHPTEQDLLDNWVRILFESNGKIDCLNGCPLTHGEMQQILEQDHRAAGAHEAQRFHQCKLGQIKVLKKSLLEKMFV